MRLRRGLLHLFQWLYQEQLPVYSLQKVRRWHMFVQQFLLERRVQRRQLLRCRGKEHGVHRLHVGWQMHRLLKRLYLEH